MHNLLSIILPVLDSMEDSHLKNQLIYHFPEQEKHFSTIEHSFKALTAGEQEQGTLRKFFHSWSQTNNSAMTVAGLSNRMTMFIHKNTPVAHEGELFRAVANLNRIVDEDLAVVGRVLHSKLFYTMATSICGNDEWLLHRYNHTSAKAFKDWKDHNSLHEKDIMIGLLTTLVHEIYTHGEVEYILPKFTQWLKQTFNFDEKTTLHSLAWISVHCGPTEKNHFFYAVNSIMHYIKAMNVNLEEYSLEPIISNYLEKKSLVMQSVMISQTSH